MGEACYVGRHPNLVEGFAMARVNICEHCLEIIRKGEDYIILQTAFEEKPMKWAHHKCHREFIKRTENDK